MNKHTTHTHTSIHLVLGKLLTIIITLMIVINKHDRYRFIYFQRRNEGSVLNETLNLNLAQCDGCKIKMHCVCMTYVNVCIYVHAHANVCMHACMYIRMCVYVYVYVCVSWGMYTFSLFGTHDYGCFPI